jgi:hypothetical protein
MFNPGEIGRLAKTVGDQRRLAKAVQTLQEKNKNEKDDKEEDVQV